MCLTSDATSAVVKGSLLTHDWYLFGGEHAEGVLSDLRVGGIDLNIDPLYETISAGSGMLFTFTLKVKADALLGLSALTWGCTTDMTTPLRASTTEIKTLSTLFCRIRDDRRFDKRENRGDCLPTAITLSSFEAKSGQRFSNTKLGN